MTAASSDAVLFVAVPILVVIYVVAQLASVLIEVLRERADRRRTRWR